MRLSATGYIIDNKRANKSDIQADIRNNILFGHGGGVNKENIKKEERLVKAATWMKNLDFLSTGLRLPHPNSKGSRGGILSRNS